MNRSLLSCTLLSLICSGAAAAEDGGSSRGPIGLSDANSLPVADALSAQRQVSVKVFQSGTGLVAVDPIVSVIEADGTEKKSLRRVDGSYFMRVAGEKFTLAVQLGDLEGSLGLSVGRMGIVDVDVYVAPDGTFSAKVHGSAGNELTDANSNAQTSAGVGGNTCATATGISGAGTFDFDNSAATTDGVGDPLCDAFGSDQLENDVWFTWTSDCDGDVTIDTCNGQTGVDTKIAVYDGAACVGAILDCNDDTCGLQSTVAFTATNGGQYTVRIGTFPGAAGGTGTFTIGGAGCGGGGGGNPACTPDAGDCNVDNGTPGCNDSDCCNTVCDCDPFCCDTQWDGFCVGPNGSTPGCSVVELGLTCDGGGGGGDTIDADLCDDAVAISGEGEFPFDNGAATTDGAPDPLCLSFGNDQIENDVWACWTAACDGSVTVQTCGLTGVDTKLAVYDGCAPGPIVGCNDDTCGLQSLVSFEAVAGNTYKIRIGTFPGAAGGPGSIAISCPPTMLPCDLTGGDNCQNFATDNASQSNDSAFRSADNFTPAASGDITDICWWGAYIPNPDADNFIVTYYGQAADQTWPDDDGGAIGGPFNQPFTLGVTGPEDTGQLVAGVAPIWEYAGNHGPVAVTAGTCYWIEVKNDPEGGVTWFWEWSFEGDGGVAVDAGPDGYGPEDLQAGNDFAFCINLGLGDVTAACAGDPAGNDLCVDAEAISGTGTFAFDNSIAGTDGLEDILCDAFGSLQVDNDVWFCWTASCTGNATIATCGLTGVDTKIAAYDGCGCPTGAALACNDDTCGLQSQIIIPVVAGSQYLIRVGTFPGAAGGLGAFSIDCSAPLTNDDCSGAIGIDPGSTTDGSTTTATLDDIADQCGTPVTAPGVWYSVVGNGSTYTATFCPQFASDCCFSNGTPGCDDMACQDTVCAIDSFCCDTSWDTICAGLAADNCGDLCQVTAGGSADYDSKLTVFCGTCEDLACIDGNDDACGLSSELTWCTQNGVTYYILVHGFGSATGNFSLGLIDNMDGPCVADPNEQCVATGACCVGSDCVDSQTAAECEMAGGEYQGDGTSCAGGFLGYTVLPGSGVFNDISGTGVEAPTASNTDDGGDVVALGFDFTFFGNTYSDVGVCSNGYLTFGPDLSDFTNDPIPDPIDPNDLIAPFWDDWSPNQGGTVVYQNDPGCFTAQWTDVPHFGGAGTATFQAKLYADGTVEYNYGAITLDSPTVGVENIDGTLGEDTTGTAGDSTAYVPNFTDPIVCEDPAVQATLIIKQGACPAPVNPGSNGLTKMVVTGDTDFDAASIDPSTVTIVRCDDPDGPGVSPDQAKDKDLNHPNEDQVGCGDGDTPCACNEDQSSDGIMDMEFKFRTSDMADAGLLAGAAGEIITLRVQGELTDGTPFFANDCVRIVGNPGQTAPAVLGVTSTKADTFVGVMPLDESLDGGGFTYFERSHVEGTVATVSPPADELLEAWMVNGEIVQVGHLPLTIQLDAGLTVVEAVLAKGGRQPVGSNPPVGNPGNGVGTGVNP